MKFAGYYAMIVGILMIAQWGFFLATGQVPELVNEPVRIAFHLAGEFITALGLIASGAAILRRAAWGVKAFLFFAGMLTYSVMVSPGYFAQNGQWIFVLMFATLLILAVTSAFVVSRQVEKGSRYA